MTWGGRLTEAEKLGAWDIYVGVELAGKQLGLVGLGRIGGRVARVGVALGMRVVAYDPYISVERYQQLDVARADSLEALLGSSDVVSLHLPLNAQTKKIMNAQRLCANEARRDLRKRFARRARR